MPPRAPSTPSSHVHRLESSPCNHHDEAHKPLGLHRVLPRPEVGHHHHHHHHHAPMSSSLISPLSSIPTDIPVDPPDYSGHCFVCLTQPNLSDCNHAPPRAVSAQYITVHCSTPPKNLILHGALQAPPSLMRTSPVLKLIPSTLAAPRLLHVSCMYKPGVAFLVYT